MATAVNNTLCCRSSPRAVEVTEQRGGWRNLLSTYCYGSVNAGITDTKYIGCHAHRKERVRQHPQTPVRGQGYSGVEAGHGAGWYNARASLGTVSNR